MPAKSGIKRSSRAEISPPVKRQKRESTGRKISYQESSDEDTKVTKVEQVTKTAVRKTAQKTNGTAVTKQDKVVQETVVSTVKKSKTKDQKKQDESMALATRTIGSKLLVGAHVSAAGGT
jgi:AP endonuclease-1